jgi:hypothetical protein
MKHTHRDLLTSHLLINVLNKGLTTSQNPPVHDVFALWEIVVVDKLLAGSSFIEFDLSEVKVERVDPLQQDVGQDLSNTFFTESKVVTSDDGGVDKEKSNSIGTVFADDLHRVGVVLELLAHFFSVTIRQP